MRCIHCGDPNQPRDNRFVSVVTRLKPNVSMQQAQTEIDTINQRLAQPVRKP